MFLLKKLKIGSSKAIALSGCLRSGFGTAWCWCVELWELASSGSWVVDKLESGDDGTLGDGSGLGGEDTVDGCAENELVAVLGVCECTNWWTGEVLFLI